MSVTYEQFVQNLDDLEIMSADEVRAQYERQTSLRTFVTAGDVANMALFLCCEAGSKISGQALGVDGHTEGIPS